MQMPHRYTSEREGYDPKEIEIPCYDLRDEAYGGVSAQNAISCRDHGERIESKSTYPERKCAHRRKTKHHRHNHHLVSARATCGAFRALIEPDAENISLLDDFTFRFTCQKSGKLLLNDPEDLDYLDYPVYPVYPVFMIT